MNAFQLFNEKLEPCGVFACGKCRIVQRTEEAARDCCDYRCPDCQQPNGKAYVSRCDKCQRVIWDRESAAKEAARFEKAEKLTEQQWAGPVAFPDDDRYFRDLGEMHDDMADDELPEYVWACDARPVCALDYDDIIENATQEAYEDFDPGSLDGEAELKAALAAFNEANKDNIVFEPNFKKAVVLNRCAESEVES